MDLSTASWKASLRPLGWAGAWGLVQAWSVADPWTGQAWWWLQIVSMVALVRLLQQAPTARAGFQRGWVFATAWLCGTFWWLFISMHTYGGLAAPLAVFAVLALAAVLALYYALGASIFVAARGHPVVFASLWTLAEMGRGMLFTGFGWGAIGYAHIDSLGGLAPQVGAYGIAWVAAFVAAQLAWLFAPRALPGPMGLRAHAGPTGLRARARALAPLVLVAIVALLPVRDGSTNAGVVDVALLQGNIKQSEKFQPNTGIADALQWYRSEAVARAANASKGQGARPLLVVMPETAIPLLPRQLPDDYLESLEAPFRTGPHALLTGIPLGSFADGYTNSVRGISAEQGPGVAGAAYRYDKHHLVPFGEFIPPLFKWFTQLMNIPLGDFKRGAVGQPSFHWNGQRLAPNICYEDLFGEELAARFADPATAPTILVNLSNIGWFGNTVAIDQHRNISRMRALEFQRPMVRATNTGDTVVIDHRGQVTASQARHTRGVLLAQVQGRGVASDGGGITPFARWAARWGQWPLALLCITIVLIAVRGLYMRTKP